MKPDLRALTDLGFTQLEAEIYYHLAQSDPTTGYQVARALGKPTANTYQAIESLLRKGAVIVDEGGERLCRAVAPDEFLNTLEREFAGRRKRAGALLADLDTPAGDDRIYGIRSHAQVLERAHRMITECRTVLLLDVSPEILHEIRPALKTLKGRGVRAAAKLYRPEKLPGVHTFAHPEGAAIEARWRGQWLNIVADGREFLMSFFATADAEPTVAYWSANTFMAWIYHSSLSSEIVLAGLSQAAKGAPSSRLRSNLERDLSLLKRLSTDSAPGARELASKLNTNPKTDSKRKQTRTPAPVNNKKRSR